MPKSKNKPFNGNITDYLFEKCLSPEMAKCPAYIVGEKSYSFLQVHQRTNKVAHAIKKLGINPGDRVMMSVIDGVDFPSIFLGTIRVGAISVAINTYLKPSDYQYYINDSGAELLIIDHSLVSIIAEIKNSLTNLKNIVVTGKKVEGYAFLDDLIINEPSQIETYKSDGDDIAFLLYSSGSTGSPKGVVHTHAHIYWATELFGLGAQGIRAGDIIQCPPKMFFAFGLGNQVYFPLRAGATVIVNSAPATPARIWDLWLQYEPTVVMSVPTIYAGMLKIAETELGQDRVRQALRRLRYGVSGGEGLPTSLYERWRSFAGLEILDGVGTTEMTHMFIFNYPGQSVPGSCGRVVEGYRVVVVDDGGKELPTGEVGNLLAFGPSAMIKYWNKPEKTASTMCNGGVLTGDKARFDEDGNLYLVGRSDDMLRVGGVWVSPFEVEAVLSRHPNVLECAVVGTADEQLMIKPKAFVVLKGNSAINLSLVENEMKEFCREHLAHIKCPRWISFLEELPKTTTGKIQRFRLRQIDKT